MSVSKENLPPGGALRAERKSLLWFQARSRSVEAVEFCDGDLASYSNASPDKDTPNEDASAIFQINRSQGIIALTDGLGGHQAGDQAGGVRSPFGI